MPRHAPVSSRKHTAGSQPPRSFCSSSKHGKSAAAPAAPAPSPGCRRARCGCPATARRRPRRRATAPRAPARPPAPSARPPRRRQAPRRAARTCAARAARHGPRARSPPAAPQRAGRRPAAALPSPAATAAPGPRRPDGRQPHAMRRVPHPTPARSDAPEQLRCCSADAPRPVAAAAAPPRPRSPVCLHMLARPSWPAHPRRRRRRSGGPRTRAGAAGRSWAPRRPLLRQAGARWGPDPEVWSRPARPWPPFPHWPHPAAGLQGAPPLWLRQSDRRPLPAGAAEERGPHRIAPQPLQQTAGAGSTCTAPDTRAWAPADQRRPPPEITRHGISVSAGAW